MSKVRNVIFDLGGVMINYNPRKFIADMGYDKALGDEVCNAIFFDPVWGDMDRGIYTHYTQALPVFIEHHPQLEKEIRSFFHPMWYDVYTVKEDTERILYNWVYEKSLNIYVLSNFSADGFAYVEKKYPFFLKKYPFFLKTLGCVVSGYEKCVKPEERIYRILLERYSLDAGECVFIDDLQANVDGARAVGMRGILFTGPEEAKKALIDMGV